MLKLKAAVTAQKKFLTVKETHSKANQMKAASKVVFDDNEDLSVQNAALQRYLALLEANTVNMGAKAAAEFNFYTLTTGLIESGAITALVTATDKISNAMTHKLQLKTANGQKCHTIYVGKTALEVGDNSVNLSALVAPTFGENIIAVSQLTAKRNKVLLTKNECLLIGASSALSDRLSIGKREGILSTDYRKT